MAYTKLNLQDRVPTYPGRVQLVPVSGQTNTYDMTLADSPTQTGDKVNAAVFAEIDAELTILDTQATAQAAQIAMMQSLIRLNTYKNIGGAL